MARPKGHPKSGGRVAGTPNKLTTDVKQAITDLIQLGAARYIEIVSNLPDEKFLDRYENMLEYVIPKLQRTEIKAEINELTTQIRTIYDDLQSEPPLPK